LSAETVLHFIENPVATWQVKATLQEEAVSPNVLYNHTSLLPDSSMPQGINYRVWKMAGETVERQAFRKIFLPIFTIKTLETIHICGF
jgi:hypothetical protein